MGAATYTMPDTPKLRVVIVEDSAIIRARLSEILTGADQSPDYAHLSAEDRRAILEILRDTWSGAPKSWSQAAQ